MTGRSGDGTPVWSESGVGFPALADVHKLVKPVVDAWQPCHRDVPHIEYRSH